LTRRVIFTPLAEAELADAIAWYEDRSLRTSERFVSDVRALRDRIAENLINTPSLRVRRAGRSSRVFPTS
jgi:plasmid stabilization system protein ParE